MGFLITNSFAVAFPAELGGVNGLGFSAPVARETYEAEMSEHVLEGDIDKIETLLYVNALPGKPLEKNPKMPEAYRG